jgi:puromycin-sensitive aminopeptidase
MCRYCALNGNAGGPTPNEHRLPRNVIPSKYEITFYPNPTGKSGRFRGKQIISVKVVEPTDTVVLNACEMKLTSVKIKRGNKSYTGKVTIDAEKQAVSIKFPKQLGKGKWKLSMNFVGHHNHKLRGWYKSKWEKNGVTQTIVCTQHEATEARKTFPCFDEPDFKAVFKVRMVIDKKLTGISNGRLVKEKSVSQRMKKVEFAPTPKMSTYLTCFIVGELVSSEPRWVNGKEMRIWCVPGKEHMTAWALECGAHALQWFEWYFGIPYFAGDKIDHIALPDFEAGAMENPGAVTYRESALLCDLAVASHSEKKGIAVTVLHETAHFWFGDLVTMEWWNGLWLNESFATFMENLCLSKWKPEWKIWDSFGSTRSAALRTDGLKSTHPIEVPVFNADDVSEIFDAISYNKGGSVLDMIHQYIGFETFRKGISIYLKRHALGNTKTSDLWDALEESCRESGQDVPVRMIMDGWVLTPGHPVVMVEGLSHWTSWSQQRFRFLNDGDSTATLWPIPVTVTEKAADGTIRKLKTVLNTQTGAMAFDKDCQWVKFNAGGTGVYRVLYSKDLALKLLSNVQENLTVIERFNLVNDAWSCVRAGISSSLDFLAIVPQFAGEMDPNVMGVLLGGLGALHRLLPEDKRQPMKSLIKDFVKPTFDTLGWAPKQGESVQDTQLRASLFSTLAVTCEDAEARAKAEQMFDSWLQDKTSIDPNLLGVVIGILSHFGDAARYSQFKQLYKDAKTPHEEALFLYNLGYFCDPELLKQTVDYCFTDEVSVQYSPGLYGALLGNKYIQDYTWDHLRANWEKVKSTFPVNMVPKVAGACGSLDTPERAAEVRSFFAANEVKAGKMAVAQMLEQLDIAVRLRVAETDRLVAHFAPTSA